MLDPNILNARSADNHYHWYVRTNMYSVSTVISCVFHTSSQAVVLQSLYVFAQFAYLPLMVCCLIV